MNRTFTSYQDADTYWLHLRANGISASLSSYGPHHHEVRVIQS